ncbi:hypothetical protein C983_01419, partial [Brucella sp. F23/97]
MKWNGLERRSDPSRSALQKIRSKAQKKWAPFGAQSSSCLACNFYRNRSGSLGRVCIQRNQIIAHARWTKPMNAVNVFSHRS